METEIKKSSVNVKTAPVRKEDCFCCTGDGTCKPGYCANGKCTCEPCVGCSGDRFNETRKFAWPIMAAALTALAIWAGMMLERSYNDPNNTYMGLPKMNRVANPNLPNANEIKDDANKVVDAAGNAVDSAKNVLDNTADSAKNAINNAVKRDYSSNKFGFSMQLPIGWVETTSDSSDTTVKFVSVETQAKLVSNEKNCTDTDPKTICDLKYAPESFQFSSSQENKSLNTSATAKSLGTATFNGVVFNKYEDGGMGGQYTWYTTEKNGKQYTFNALSNNVDELEASLKTIKLF